MLKHRSTDHSHTYIPPDAFSNWTHQTAQQGAEAGTGEASRRGVRAEARDTRLRLRPRQRGSAVCARRTMGGLRVAVRGWAWTRALCRRWEGVEPR